MNDLELDDAEFPLTPYSDAAVKDLNRPRGGQRSAFLLKFGEPGGFTTQLARDVQHKQVDGNVVHIAVVGGPAREAQVDWPNIPPEVRGRRRAVWFSSRFLEASYFTQGMVVKMSVYCGVVYVGPARQEGLIDRWSGPTTDRHMSLARQVQVAALHWGLEVSPGTLDVVDPTDSWRANWDQFIDSIPTMSCLHCGKEIYFANLQWRHVDTHRAEATVPGPSSDGKRTIQKLDHVAEPEGVAS